MNKPKSYIICSVQRSGSTFVCETLKNTGVAGRPGEALLFFERECKDALGDDEKLLERIAEIHRKGQTPNGVFGLKLMWTTAKPFFARMKLIPAFADLSPHHILVKLFGDCRYVFLERCDKVGSAISTVKLNQRNAAGVKVAHAKTEEDLLKIRKFVNKYDYQKIDDAHKNICIQYLQWQVFFIRNNIAPQHITFEDFLAHLDDNVSRVLDYIRVPKRSASAVFPTLLRQADASSIEWATKYLAERENRLIK